MGGALASLKQSESSLALVNSAFHQAIWSADQGHQASPNEGAIYLLSWPSGNSCLQLSPAITHYHTAQTTSLIVTPLLAWNHVMASILNRCIVSKHHRASVPKPTRRHIQNRQGSVRIGGERDIYLYECFSSSLVAKQSIKGKQSSSPASSPARYPIPPRNSPV